ncbi:MAG TPA: flagellar basal body P-ring formation chaperone FlgA, partial [bacterium]|nr:flagellar basal body P-ring formation chaperone FlgA [bacterium]
GDIADVSGSQAALLSKVLLQSAPLTGRTQSIKAPYVLLKLRQSGFDTDSLELTGAQAVKMSTPGNLVPSHELAQRFEDGLRERLGADADRCEISLNRAPTPLFVPDGTYEWEVRPSSANLLGTVPVQLLAKNPESGQVVASTRGCAQVRRFEEVLVSTREIARGSTITDKDLNTERKEITNLLQLRDLITDPKAAVGLKARRFIALGETLKTSSLEREKVVAYGQTVLIEIEGTGFVITAPGVARQAGSMGDQIRVKSTTGGQEMLTQVIGPGKVRAF